MPKQSRNMDTLRSRSWLLHSLTRISNLAWPVLPPRAERKQHVLRNAIVILYFDFLWGLGFSMCFHNTVLTGCLKSLGAYQILVGLVPGLYYGLYSLVQPLSTFWIKPRRGRLGLTVLLYSGAAISYVAMGSALIWLPVGMVIPRIAAVFAFMLICLLGMGLADPHYVAMVMETIHPEWRGRFYALKGAVLGIGWIVGSVVFKGIMDRIGVITNYGVALFVGGLTIILASLVWSRFHEHHGSCERIDRQRLGAYLHHLFLRFRSIPGFGRFVMCTGVFTAMGGISGYANTYVRDFLSETERIDGVLSIAFALSSVAGSLLFGVLTSAVSFRRAYAVGALCIALGFSVMVATDLAVSEEIVMADGLGKVLAVAGYFLISLWLPAQIVCAFNLCMRVAHKAPAAEAYAAMSLSVLLFRFSGPVVSSWIIDQWPSCQKAVFVCAAAISFILAMLMVTWLHDPMDRGKLSIQKEQ